MDAEDVHYIYRASIRLRNGKRIYAWQYGLKAFRLRIKGPSIQLSLPGI